MLGTNGYEWLGEVSMRNRKGTHFFGNLKTHYNVPGEQLKHVAEANQISVNIHYKNENTSVTFEVYVRRIKDIYKILKDYGEIQNYSHKVQK